MLACPGHTGPGAWGQSHQKIFISAPAPLGVEGGQNNQREAWGPHSAFVVKYQGGVDVDRSS